MHGNIAFTRRGRAGLQRILDRRAEKKSDSAEYSI